MATKTTTLTLPLTHLYYLTADGNNQTGYTLDEVRALIDEKGGDYQIEATITHPVPPEYSVEWDIESHQQRIDNNNELIFNYRQDLSNLKEGSDEYKRIEETITQLESDIQHCLDHIKSLEDN